ncbi:MAG: type II toxin-antitoxin system toxin DNA ADP-ribosyl transferase DarT [Burkholderiales bacterium]
MFAKGALLSKNKVSVDGINYENIAHQGAQGARAAKSVPNPPGGNVHDYVPFYFAPRSPMLYAINGGKVLNCNLRQSDIVHFETTVDDVKGHAPFVFFDRNATLAYSKPYTNLAHLDQIAWDLITEPPQMDGFCRYWQNDHSKQHYVDRMEKRMAEFLVKTSVPINAINRIGVIDRSKQDEVIRIVNRYNLNIPVVVMPDWYF